MTEKEKAAAGYLYNANYDDEILADISHCADMCFEYNSIRPSDIEARYKKLGEIIGHLGKDAIVTPPFHCDYGYNVTMGDYFYSNYNLMMNDGAPITFGDHVFVAPNCCFTTAEHAIDAEQRNEGLEIARPITIGDNVWIGAGCVILAGVTIGNNTVIGAGSVVTKSIPAGVVAVGSPCRVMRKITAADKNKYKRYEE